MKHQIDKRLTLVSNRLPFVIEQNINGLNLRPSSGGLVTAMHPVLCQQGGTWIGWPGTFEDIDINTIKNIWYKTSNYKIQPVRLTPEEHDKFYYGFSNEILWPLFHDLQSRCNFFDTGYWHTYKQVNQRFAKVITETYQDNDFIWVHDYHLINVGQELRKLGIRSEIGFFLHIPFPPPDIFFKLPWREELITAFLEYDLVGFQTQHDRNNFLQCVRILMKYPICIGKGRNATIQVGNNVTKAGYFPIGIDYDEFAVNANSDKIAFESNTLRKNLLNRWIVFGVDRLDYTKGITCKLEAFRNALTRFPELHKKISFVQVIVPSRENIPQYNSMKAEIERLVGEVNGQFTMSGWVPIHYVFRNLTRDELLAYYRCANAALVTPLKDGMNLVAKEYCAANVDNEGVLILSEFAGAVDQLHKNALLVNPYDIENVANTIQTAFLMSVNERKTRMKKLKKIIRKHDVFWWVESFLQATSNKNAHNLRLVKNDSTNTNTSKLFLATGR